MQFLVFMTVVAFIGVLFFAKKETLPKKTKIIIFLVIAHAVLFAWVYEFNSTKSTEQNRAVLNAFKQGKSVYCDGLEVSSKAFIFVSGTLSFIAQDNNQNQKGLVIDIATCKLVK